MPIFEYTCPKCKADFELLVRGDKIPSCPSCGSEALDKQFSTHGVSGDGTREKGLRAARKRDKIAAKDRMETQRVYEESHDRHGH